MSIEAMKQALEIIKNMRSGYGDDYPTEKERKTITALRQAIEQAEKQALVSSLYSIEPHGDGYAIYCGRDWQHHGMNIGHLTEVTPAAIKLIETALNQKTGQAEKQEPVAWIQEDRIVPELGYDCTMTREHPKELGYTPLYTAPPQAEKQQALDKKADNARELGLSYEQAEKQEPVRWFQQFGDSPPRNQWVGLTDDEIWDAYEKGMYEEMWFARAVEAKLKEKNGG